MPKRSSIACALSLLLSLVPACDAPAGLVSGASGIPVERQGLLPIIEGLEPDPAEVGAEVTLRGTFHKLRQDDGLFVSFNGYDSPHVTHVSDALLRAVVPEGATSGNVVVVIGESVGKGRFLKIRGRERD